MIRFSILILFALLMLPNSSKAEAVVISINQETQFGQSVFITAPIPLLGNGDVTKAVKLSPHNYPTWTITAELPDGMTLPVTFWLRQDAPETLGDPGNGSVITTENFVTSAANQSDTTDQNKSAKVESISEPEITSFNFQPTGFLSRRVRVITPRGYAENTEKTYPMMIVQDGQNVISPGGPFGSWDLDLQVAEMIRLGELPECIVVAIDNTNDRFAEYIPEYGEIFNTQGRGGEYLSRIVDELIPRIQQDYRVKAEAKYVLHVGSSLGGLLGFHAANEFESTFGSVIAMSPSFQINTNENLSRAALASSEFARIYLDSGTAGTSNDGYANTTAVRDALIESGHVFGPEFYHVVGNGQQHNEAAWRSRLQDALRWWAAPVIEELENENNKADSLWIAK